MKIAIIPARGGSKRIPGKNIKLFHGKPIIAYSVELAISSGLFDRVIVSTDDKKISDIASAHGAEVPFVRPSAISNDTASTIDVLLHAEKYLQTSNLKYLCCIYPTAPLLQKQFLEEGLVALKEDDTKQFSLSVTKYQYPVRRSFMIEDGNIEMLFPENYLKNTQDVGDVYHDAGQFYWWRAGTLSQNSCFFSYNSFPVYVPNKYVCDIDEMDDFVLAELKYTKIRKESRDLV